MKFVKTRGVQLLFSGVLVYWCMVALYSMAENAGVTKKEDKVILMLRSANLPERMNAFKSMRDERKQRVQELIDIVKTHDEQWADSTSPRGLACRVLGEMRAVEATDALLSILHIEGMNDEIANSPAFDALVRIGVLGKAKLIEYISASENGQSRRLVAKCLRSIYGPECAVVVLRASVRKEKNEKRKSRLSEAAALIAGSDGQ